jgi:hypothetical protein
MVVFLPVVLSIIPRPLLQFILFLIVPTVNPKISPNEFKELDSAISFVLSLSLQA